MLDSDFQLKDTLSVGDVYYTCK